MLVAWILSLAPSHATVVDRVAAVVNNEVIAQSEIYELGGDFVDRKCPVDPAAEAPDPSHRACVLNAELEILDVEIKRVLVEQELRRLGLEVKVADVDKQIDATVREYPSIPDREALRAEVERAGKSWSQYRSEIMEFLRNQTFQARILAPRVTISDDELRDRYQRESRKMRTPTALLEGFAIDLPEGGDPTETLDRVDAIVTRINTGELAWEDAVAKYDEAGMSGSFGREVAPGELVPQLDEVVVAAQVGVAQGPILIGSTLYVVSVRGTGERSVDLTFEEAKEQIRNVVFQEKLVQAEEEWYQRARREASIVIRLK